MYQDLSPHHDCPFKKDIVDLPIKMKGNSSKRASGKSLSSVGAQGPVSRESWGPFLERHGNFTGPKSNIQNEI